MWKKRSETEYHWVVCLTNSLNSDYQCLPKQMTFSVFSSLGATKQRPALICKGRRRSPNRSTIKEVCGVLCHGPINTNIGGKEAIPHECICDFMQNNNHYNHPLMFLQPTSTKTHHKNRSRDNCQWKRNWWSLLRYRLDPQRNNNSFEDCHIDHIYFCWRRLANSCCGWWTRNEVNWILRGNGGVASVWIHSQGWRTWGLGKTACGSGIFLHVPVSCASIQWAKEVAVVIVATDCSIWGGLIGASKACCPFEMVLMFRLFSWIFGLEGSRNWKKKENLLFKEKGRKTKYPESDRKWIQYLRSVLPLR